MSCLIPAVSHQYLVFLPSQVVQAVNVDERECERRISASALGRPAHDLLTGDLGDRDLDSLTGAT